MMRQRRLAVFVLTSLCLLPLTGCTSLLKALTAGIQEPTLEFDSLSVKRVDMSGMDLDVVFKVTNPNGIDLSLADVDFALKLEGEEVASERPTAGLRLPGKSTVLLPFSTQIRFAQMLAVGRAFLTHGSAKFRADGAVGIQTPVGILRLPFAKEGTVEMPSR